MMICLNGSYFTVTSSSLNRVHLRVVVLVSGLSSLLILPYTMVSQCLEVVALRVKTIFDPLYLASTMVTSLGSGRWFPPSLTHA